MEFSIGRSSDVAVDEAGEKWAGVRPTSIPFLANSMVNFINISIPIPLAQGKVRNSNSMQWWATEESIRSHSICRQKPEMCLKLFQWQWIKLSTPNACPYFKDVDDVGIFTLRTCVYCACVHACSVYSFQNS